MPRRGIPNDLARDGPCALTRHCVRVQKGLERWAPRGSELLDDGYTRGAYYAGLLHQARLRGPR